MKNYKNLIKVIIFIFIFCILWHITFKILWGENTALSYFYEEKENTIDVAYVGASNVYVYFNTTLAYNEYGFTTYNIATDSQPFVYIKYLLKEIQKYQKPKLYIIDITRIISNPDYYDENSIRKLIDSMKKSYNQYEALTSVLDYLEMPNEERVNYYFSFLLYHNRWEDFKGKSLTENTNLYKGFQTKNYNFNIKPQKKILWNNDSSIKVTDKNKEVLLDLLEYINDNNLNVLFTIPCRTFNATEMSKLNDATKIINKYDYQVINFNQNDSYIDYSNDLYNPNHLNIYGSTKFTLYFAKYLDNIYNLPDHRNDEKYSSWVEEYNRFKSKYEQKTNNNFEALVKE